MKSKNNPYYALVKAAKLIPYLSEVQNELVQNELVLKVIQDTEDWVRGHVFADLVACTQGEKRNQFASLALEAARATIEGERAGILRKLAPYLTADKLSEALKMTQDMIYEDYRYTVLIVASQCKGELLSQGIKTILDFGKILRYKMEYEGALIKLTPYLQGALLDRVLKAFLHVDDYDSQVIALTSLVPKLENHNQKQYLLDIGKKCNPRMI